MMHPSDPVVWWSPHLIFSEPDWISEPHGKDVLAGMFWMPLVTFWRVTADLPFAQGVPAGHGHHYTAKYIDGWNADQRASAPAPVLGSGPRAGGSAREPAARPRRSVTAVALPR